MRPIRLRKAVLEIRSDPIHPEVVVKDQALHFGNVGHRQLPVGW